MTIEIKLWLLVLYVLAAFEAGIFFIVWWISIFRDDPVEAEQVPVVGTDADAARYMMEGKL